MIQHIAPALVLFLLAPLVAEVLFGATPITRIGALLPVIPLYGGGALLICELARRRSSGWARIALLSAAYAVVEEELALQSMFDPALFGASGHNSSLRLSRLPFNSHDTAALPVPPERLSWYERCVGP